MISRRLPFAIGAMVLVALPVGRAAATPPGSAYAWAQPGTAPVEVPFAQPPAWVPISGVMPAFTIPGSDYAWAQRGTAPVEVPFTQPPARVGSR